MTPDSDKFRIVGFVCSVLLAQLADIDRENDIDAFWYASVGLDANAARMGRKSGANVAQMALGQESAIGALLIAS